MSDSPYELVVTPGVAKPQELVSSVFDRIREDEQRRAADEAAARRKAEEELRAFARDLTPTPETNTTTRSTTEETK